MNIDLNVLFYTLGIYAAIVVSPGPNFALISRLALQGRTYATQGAISGLALAATFYAVLAMFGLSALLLNFSWLVRGVQIIGGAYLVYLGVLSWRTQGVDVVNSNYNEPAGSINAELYSGLKVGALVNLSNPKGIAFFIGLYAVAVPLDTNMMTRVSILLGGIFLELVWYNLVAIILSRSYPRKVYDKARTFIDKAIGTVLIIVGGKMILNR